MLRYIKIIDFWVRKSRYRIAICDSISSCGALRHNVTHLSYVATQVQHLQKQMTSERRQAQLNTRHLANNIRYDTFLARQLVVVSRLST